MATPLTTCHPAWSMWVYWAGSNGLTSVGNSSGLWFCSVLRVWLDSRGGWQQAGPTPLSGHGRSTVFSSILYQKCLKMKVSDSTQRASKKPGDASRSRLSGLFVIPAVYKGLRKLRAWNGDLKNERIPNMHIYGSAPPPQMNILDPPL